MTTVAVKKGFLVLIDSGGRESSDRHDGFIEVQIGWPDRGKILFTLVKMPDGGMLTLKPRGSYVAHAIRLCLEDGTVMAEIPLEGHAKAVHGDEVDAEIPPFPSWQPGDEQEPYWWESYPIGSA